MRIVEIKVNGKLQKFKVKNKLKNCVECDRCGVCCMLGPCDYGKSLKNSDPCIYLIMDGKIASCKLIVEGKFKPRELNIGIGCWQRHEDSVLNEHGMNFEREYDWIIKEYFKDPTVNWTKIEDKFNLKFS